MSIGEFRTVENECGLIIKLKMAAFSSKAGSGFTPGECGERECRSTSADSAFNGGALGVGFKEVVHMQRVEGAWSLPPSALPGISPSRGEIELQ